MACRPSSSGTATFRSAAWKHGLSLYGLDESNDGGFTARHPELSTGRGTVKLPTRRADDFSDDELTATLKAVLGP